MNEIKCNEIYKIHCNESITTWKTTNLVTFANKVTVLR